MSLLACVLLQIFCSFSSWEGSVPSLPCPSCHLQGLDCRVVGKFVRGVWDWISVSLFLGRQSDASLSCPPRICSEGWEQSPWSHAGEDHDKVSPLGQLFSARILGFNSHFIASGEKGRGRGAGWGAANIALQALWFPAQEGRQGQKGTAKREALVLPLLTQFQLSGTSSKGLIMPCVGPPS